MAESENADQRVDGLLLLQGDRAMRATYRAKCLAAAGRYDRAALGMEMLGVLEAAAQSPQTK